MDEDMKADALPKAEMPQWLKAILQMIVVAIGMGGSAAGTYYATREAGPDVPTPAPIVLPEKVVGDVRTVIDVTAVTESRMVRWRSLDEGLLVIDDLPDLIARKSIKVIACKAGSYRVECWGAISGDPTTIHSTVVVVGKKPSPPGPAPKPPEPIPPEPAPPKPKPIPPTPTPVDPLIAKIQKAYDADLAPLLVKRSQVAMMTELYTAMVAHSKDQGIKTLDDLLSDYQIAANGKAGVPGLLTPNVLMECRGIVAGEVLAALSGEMGVALDDAMRGKAVALWTRLAAAMQGVK